LGVNGVSLVLEVELMIMKDQIKCNIITKHLAGLCTKEEEKFLKQWLQADPRHSQFFSAIKFQTQFNPQNRPVLQQHA
jgi:hypothetical protein